MTKPVNHNHGAELMNNLRYITENVSRSEILAQLAEEASELSQAALKMRRAEDGKNPTPMSTNDGRLALLQEWADVNLCAMALSETGLDLGTYETQVIIESKANRWANRLSENISKQNQEAKS